MSSAKVLTYTDAQTAELVSAYQASPTDATVEAFATKFGKSARSVVSKLASEKVYVSKAKPAATRVTKAQLVEVIEATLGLDAGALSSFEKATHEQLETMADMLAE